jgi:hypothetical protein
MQFIEVVFLIATVFNLLLVGFNLYSIKGVTINVNMPEKVVDHYTQSSPTPLEPMKDLYDDKGELKETPEDFLRDIAQNIQAIMLGQEVEDVRK